MANGADIEWNVLNDEIKKLYRTGKYDRGVVVAKKTLEVAEQNVGPDHPDIASILTNLTMLYLAMNRDDYRIADRTPPKNDPPLPRVLLP